MLTINRTYAKRETEKSDWNGKIGEVELTVGVEDGKIIFLLDGVKLPEVSARHLMNFALQTLQDAYAGAKSLSEAEANFDKKRKALLEGTIGVRGSGDGESEAEKIGRQLVLAEFKANLGKGWKESEKWIAFDKLSDEEKEAKLDAALEKNRDHFEPKVKAEIARREEARRAKAAIMADTRIVEL